MANVKKLVVCLLDCRGQPVSPGLTKLLDMCPASNHISRVERMGAEERVAR
jgi:hypothetical protein